MSWVENQVPVSHFQAVSTCRRCVLGAVSPELSWEGEVPGEDAHFLPESPKLEERAIGLGKWGHTGVLSSDPEDLEDNML